MSCYCLFSRLVIASRKGLLTFCYGSFCSRSSQLYRKGEIGSGSQWLPTQGHLASELEIGLSTINKFFNGKPVYFSKCEDICHRLGLQWQEIIDLGNDDVTAVAPKIAETQTAQNSETIAKRSSVPLGFYSWDDSWVGREKLILELSAKLSSECCLLLILGLTCNFGGRCDRELKEASTEHLYFFIGFFDSSPVAFCPNTKIAPCFFSASASFWRSG